MKQLCFENANISLVQSDGLLWVEGPTEEVS